MKVRYDALHDYTVGWLVTVYLSGKSEQNSVEQLMRFLLIFLDVRILVKSVNLSTRVHK